MSSIVVVIVVLSPIWIIALVAIFETIWRSIRDYRLQKRRRENSILEKYERTKRELTFGDK